MATLSSVATDRWPKAGWLPFWPPLLSGGTAGPTLSGWTVRGPGYPDFGSEHKGGASERFRAGLQSLGQGLQVCYRFGSCVRMALMVYMQWEGLQVGCCLLNGPDTAGA